MSKVAVIGGGVFGCTAAIYLARAGHEVHLFEKNNALLYGASGSNQYRIHRGYHYPRSKETARSAMQAEKAFRIEYKKSLIDSGRHFYAVAREKSHITGEEFLTFCDELGLEYKKVETGDLVTSDMVELFVEVQESWFDPNHLRNDIVQKLLHANVHVYLNQMVDATELSDFDRVVIATYANLNDAIGDSSLTQDYKYQVCEKPVVMLPQIVSDTGIVVIDGPFMSVDPLGDTHCHVLGNVKHAIHAENTGAAPIIPAKIKDSLHKGIIKNFSVTKIDSFLSHGAQYIPALAHAKHVGSMFTIRTILPKQETTDARPTLVTTLNERYIQIFSGKIGNCVTAAQQVVDLI